MPITGMSWLLASKKSKKTFKPGSEIQDMIWQETPFVPAFSVKYTVNDKQEPVFLENDMK